MIDSKTILGLDTLIDYCEKKQWQLSENRFFMTQKTGWYGSVKAAMDNFTLVPLTPWQQGKMIRGYLS